MFILFSVLKSTDYYYTGESLPEHKVIDMVCVGGRCKIVKRHGLVYEDRHDGMRRLKLVRGLSNMFGQYNCFLNVIIQSLWHLPAFRTALLTLPSALDNGKSSTANGASPRDAAVVRALHNVFAAFSKAPSEAQQTAAQRDAQVQSASADSAPAQRLQQQEQAESSASASASETDAAVRQSVSPDELREALSDLEKGQSPVEFELSEMHDAAEVIYTFLCLNAQAQERCSCSVSRCMQMYLALVACSLHKGRQLC